MTGARTHAKGDMMATQDRVLAAEQIAHFLENGYVKVPGCFSREAAKRYTDATFSRLGYDPDDETTWEKSVIHMPAHQRFAVEAFAPKAWRAACELLGGAGRIQQPWQWGDSFIVNLNEGADRAWEPPSAQTRGWHKDGDFFRHFLDSPEQGLLTFVLWSDVEPRGGATLVATDSVPVVARFLAEHPEGVLPTDIPFRDLITRCHTFVEATGQVGDVYFLHPYMLHAQSQNVLRRTRIITNPTILLSEPMNFNRADPADFSPVERAVLRALGVERLDFRSTGERARCTGARYPSATDVRGGESAPRGPDRISAPRQAEEARMYHGVTGPFHRRDVLRAALGATTASAAGALLAACGGTGTTRATTSPVASAATDLATGVKSD